MLHMSMFHEYFSNYDIHIESTKLSEFENKKNWSNIELHLLQVCDEYRKAPTTINITISLLVPAMSDAYVCVVQNSVRTMIFTSKVRN